MESEPSGSRNPPRGGFLALDVRTEAPDSLSRHQTRIQLSFDKGKDPVGRLVSNRHTYIYNQKELKCKSMYSIKGTY